MAEERARRRLAAILAADVVGYSRLMERDEAGTMAALAHRRKEAAIEHFERAAQLLETDYYALGAASQCYKVLGRRDEYKAVARRSLERIEREVALRPD